MERRAGPYLGGSGRRGRRLRPRPAAEPMTKLQRLLADLPDEPDLIAEYFAVQGIKGLRCHPALCPLAMYLASNGCQTPNVGGEFVGLAQGELRQLPPAASAFAADFDAGRYPDLEAKPSNPAPTLF